MLSIQSPYSLQSQVLYDLRGEKSGLNLDFSSTEQLKETMLNRKNWNNATDEVGVINRPLGKEIEKLSSEVITEMSKDGVSHFDMKMAFKGSVTLDSHFEGSSFVVENPDFIKSSVKGYTNSTQYFDKRLLDSEIYKNFEPLEDVYQSETFWGANDKMSRFKEVVDYAILNNATEEEMANKDFQIEAQNFANSFHEFNDIGFQAEMENNGTDGFPFIILSEDPTHKMISTDYKGFSKDTIETLKEEHLQNQYDIYNRKMTAEEKVESGREFFKPTLEEILPNASGEGVYASKQFDSLSDVLDFIKEKREYLKKHPEHRLEERNNIQLDFLNRLEEKLMDDISTVSTNSAVKFENGMIIGQLYG
ncbi:MAG: hypothetical protein U9N02_04350 [Campylobacterota bacterium]|nr:hypothetical protein [Campylobacterota bacterium]